MCPNTFVMLSENASKEDMFAMLCYFPTIDTEKLTYELTQGQNKSPCFLKNLSNDNEKEKDFSKVF